MGLELVPGLELELEPEPELELGRGPAQQPGRARQAPRHRLARTLNR